MVCLVRQPGLHFLRSLWYVCDYSLFRASVHSAMKEQLRHFIVHSMIKDPRYPLTDDEPLITGGLVDSFSLVELALFIEQTFGVPFSDTELTAENMDTLDKIVANIEAKL